MKQIITTLSRGAVNFLAGLIRKKINVYSTDFGSSSERIDVFDGRTWISIFGFMNDDEEPDQENEDGHTFAIAKKKESDNPGRLLVDGKIVESISTITMENHTSKRGLDVISENTLVFKFSDKTELVFFVFNDAGGLIDIYDSEEKFSTAVTPKDEFMETLADDSSVSCITKKL